MKAVVFTTKNTAYVRDCTPSLIKSVVGGFVKPVYPHGLPGYLMLVDDHAIFKALHINLIGTLFRSNPGHPIVGDIVITSDDPKQIFRGLDDNQVAHVIAEARRQAKRFGREIRMEEPDGNF